MSINEIEHILKPIDPNIILDSEQKEIVINEEKELMVIAGAGSGKTTTIVAKVLYLIKYKHINPKEILIISFTNETVNDLKRQLHHIMKLPVAIMTFHKLGLEIIKKEFTDVTILSDKERLVTIIIKTLYQNDSIFKSQLKKFLNHYIRRVNDSMITKKCNFEKIESNQRYQKFLSILFSFWNQWDEFQKEQLELNIPHNSFTTLNLFLSIFEKIKTIYDAYKKRYSLFDFHDMITVSTKVLNKCDDTMYQYVFVDEYQDISRNRFCLLQQLVKGVNTKLVVVGDDWQSIYHFSGSDSKLFTEFKSFFPNSQIKMLTMTYRNSNELIKIAGNFIMKNPDQIKKNLKSNKNIEKPIVFVYYKKYCFHQKINQILEQAAIENKKQSILILGRYRHDINRLYGNDNLKKVSRNRFCYKNYSKMSICFLTIHAAKGLGFDQVILINLENGIYGFPSKVNHSKIFAIFQEDNECYKMEERRLFYVALTRTKNRVYLCIPYFHQSKFIYELKKLV